MNVSKEIRGWNQSIIIKEGGISIKKMGMERERERESEGGKSECVGDI